MHATRLTCDFTQGKKQEQHHWKPRTAAHLVAGYFERSIFLQVKWSSERPARLLCLERRGGEVRRHRGHRHGRHRLSRRTVLAAHTTFKAPHVLETLLRGHSEHCRYVVGDDGRQTDDGPQIKGSSMRLQRVLIAVELQDWVAHGEELLSRRILRAQVTNQASGSCSRWTYGHASTTAGTDRPRSSVCRVLATRLASLSHTRKCSDPHDADVHLPFRHREGTRLRAIDPPPPRRTRSDRRNQGKDIGQDCTSGTR